MFAGRVDECFALKGFIRTCLSGYALLVIIFHSIFEKARDLLSDSSWFLLIGVKGQLFSLPVNKWALLAHFLTLHVALSSSVIGATVRLRVDSILHHREGDEVVAATLGAQSLHHGRARIW